MEKVEISFRATQGERAVRFAWMSLQPDGSISIGIADRTFMIKMRAADGKDRSDGNAVIRAPHVTFHPSTALTHITGKGAGAKVEALTWAEPSSGEFAAPWIVVTTPPLSSLRDSRARENVSTEIWNLPVPTLDCSAQIIGDFVQRFVNNGIDRIDRTARYVRWGKVVVRFKVHLVAAQEGEMELFTLG